MSVLHRHTATGLARFLGWFSVGLGAAQLAVPDAVNRQVGVQPTEANGALMRAVGVREIVAGLGLLTRREPSGFLWARVAGDVMDLALLGNALSADSDKRRAGVAVAAVAGITAVDVIAGARRRAAAAPLSGPLVRAS